VKPANLGVSGFAGRLDIAAMLPWAPGVRKSAACAIVTGDGRREISRAAFFLG
jgi:hypothetical protein